jgi:UDP-N-acetylglucosamine transferase subunit ALG13
MEETVLKQLLTLNLKILLVRGLPGDISLPPHVSKDVIIKNYLNTHDLNLIIEESEIVICRSGYSSIMDLAALNKKVIFIPTPGQTEQEYLAQVLSERKIAYCTTLDKLNITETLKLSSGFSGFNLTVNSHLLLKALDELLL